MSETLSILQIDLLKFIFHTYPEPIEFGKLGVLYNEMTSIDPKRGEMIAEALLFLDTNGFVEKIIEKDLSVDPLNNITAIKLTKKGIDILVHENHITQTQILDKMAEMTNTIETTKSNVDKKISNLENKINDFNFKIIEISAVILAIFTFLNIDIKGIDKILYLPWWQALIYYAAINATLVIGIYMVLRLTGLKRKK